MIQDEENDMTVCSLHLVLFFFCAEATLIYLNN
jgi:hypothetical protein